MKHSRKFTLLLVLLMMISSLGMLQPSSAFNDINTSWAFDGQGQLVYDVINVSYDQDNYWNMSYYDDILGQEVENGAIRQGDLFFVNVEHFEDLSDQDNDHMRVGLKSTSTYEGWSHEYDWNTTYGQYPDFGGPAFFMPLITVPQTYLADNANTIDWDHVVTTWDSYTAWSASIDYVTNEYNLTGSADTSMNVTEFTAVWDIDTGILKSYRAAGNDDSSKNYFIELEFKYIRDQSQWGLSWGVSPGLMWAYEIETNFTSGLEFGDNSEHDQYWEPKYLYNDDLLVFSLYELSDFGDFMNWNGSAMTSNWEMEFHYMFSDIGGKSDGPRVWYPILPIGNENFMENITDDFIADGAILTQYSVGSTYTIGYDDDFGYENATWDLTTGLMETMYIEGDFNEGIGYISLKLIYDFNPGTTPHFSTDHFDQRYVINDVQNGTLDELDFGNVEYVDENGNNAVTTFKLFDGDIFQVNAGWETMWVGDQEVTEFVWEGYTSSGYWLPKMNTHLRPPGIEQGQDGPPMLYFIIPNESETKSGDAWWNELTGVYNALGYTVSNTAEEFGFEANIGEFYLNIMWSKADGILDYYLIETTEQTTAGEVQLRWEMSRGVSMIDDTTLSWGVDVGTTMDFIIAETSGPIPFAESDELNLNDTITVEFKSLGDLENEGPSVIVDMTANGVTETDVEMGIKTPGFEFTNFENENGDGGPILLYWAIPTGPDSFWNWLVDIYTESGYTPSQTADTFSVSLDKNGIQVDATWSKDTGLLQTYSYSGPIDSDTLTFRIERISESIVDPTNQSSPTDDGPGIELPVSNSIYVALPFMAFATMVVRRRKFDL